MCSPAVLIGAGAVAGGVASVAGYVSTRDAMQQQSALAMQNATMQQQQYMMQSAFQAMQASAFMSQSGALMRQADAFIDQSKIAAKTGEILQENQMFRAAQAERERDEQARKATVMRKQLIGEGTTRFAANGVLIESRPQSAVAMWEQDEVADLAFELSNIKRIADNEIFGFVQQGNQDRIQSLFSAEAMRLQAEGAKIEAGTAAINAQGAMMQSRLSVISGQMAIVSGRATAAQADAATDAALWNMIGNLSGIGMNVGTMMASGGASRTAKPTYPGISNTPQSPLVHTYQP